MVIFILTDLSDGRKKLDGNLCHSFPTQTFTSFSGDKRWTVSSLDNLYSSPYTSIGAWYPRKINVVAGYRAEPLMAEQLYGLL